MHPKITIDHLLGLHDRFRHKNALRLCLGDGVLYSQNPLYRQLRKLLFQRGAKFCSAASLLTKTYNAIPLLTIDRIVSSRTLPYKDNVTPLRHLSKRIKKSAFATPFLLDGNFANPILHESAHVVISSLDPYQGVTRSTEYRMLEVAVLAEEAFATAIELLACAFVQDYEHGMYLAFNSYNADNVVRVDGAKMLVEELGITGAFVLCCTALLISRSWLDLSAFHAETLTRSAASSDT